MLGIWPFHRQYLCTSTTKFNQGGCRVEFTPKGTASQAYREIITPTTTPTGYTIHVRWGPPEIKERGRSI
ncbi:unnamed protein product [Clonostachys chloroleuca]|uniref:Uncharacterized protein n=1 Tax=Clonostachys chloroleuca TaxID=1926264 RepID=A0AA35LZ58_9HYPO|nr:unnamed protein product [Clonostachys chloroleuca]